MEYFYGGGGNPTPDFVYRFTITELTDEMYDWCTHYPLEGPFERWWVSRKMHSYKGGMVPTIQIQFESRKAAYMFMLTYSEYITENKSIYEVTP